MRMWSRRCLPPFGTRRAALAGYPSCWRKRRCIPSPQSQTAIAETPSTRWSSRCSPPRKTRRGKSASRAKSQPSPARKKSSNATSSSFMTCSPRFANPSAAEIPTRQSRGSRGFSMRGLTRGSSRGGSSPTRARTLALQTRRRWCRRLRRRTRWSTSACRRHGCL